MDDAGIGAGSFTEEGRLLCYSVVATRGMSYSGDRTQFLGRNNAGGKPFALGRIRLDNRTGAGLDPAAALQLPIVLEPGQQTRCKAAQQLGETSDVTSSARTGRTAIRNRARWTDVRSTRRSRGAGCAIKPPRKCYTPMLLSTDFLLNRWLPYQALLLPLSGRTAMHQSSGAYRLSRSVAGFTGIPLYRAGDRTRSTFCRGRAAILEGDAGQHTGGTQKPAMAYAHRAGSDDMAWLPFVTAHYVVSVTGDTGILDEQIPFLDAAAPLGEHELEKMFVPAISTQSAISILEHCQPRDLIAWWTAGRTGLPLTGFVRLERRHEPGGRGRPGGERVARLVPMRGIE